MSDDFFKQLTILKDSKTYVKLQKTSVEKSMLERIFHQLIISRSDKEKYARLVRIHQLQTILRKKLRFPSQLQSFCLQNLLDAKNKRSIRVLCYLILMNLSTPTYVGMKQKETLPPPKLLRDGIKDENKFIFQKPFIFTTYHYLFPFKSVPFDSYFPKLLKLLLKKPEREELLKLLLKKPEREEYEMQSLFYSHLPQWIKFYSEKMSLTSPSEVAENKSLKTKTSSITGNYLAHSQLPDSPEELLDILEIRIHELLTSQENEPNQPTSDSTRAFPTILSSMGKSTPPALEFQHSYLFSSIRSLLELSLERSKYILISLRKSKVISTSKDEEGSTTTTFLDRPVFLQSLTEYCFLVLQQATRIYMDSSPTAVPKAFLEAVTCETIQILNDISKLEKNKKEYERLKLEILKKNRREEEERMKEKRKRNGKRTPDSLDFDEDDDDPFHINNKGEETKLEVLQDESERLESIEEEEEEENEGEGADDDDEKKIRSIKEEDDEKNEKSSSYNFLRSASKKLEEFFNFLSEYMKDQHRKLRVSLQGHDREGPPSPNHPTANGHGKAQPLYFLSPFRHSGPVFIQLLRFFLDHADTYYFNPRSMIICFFKDHFKYHMWNPLFSVEIWQFLIEKRELLETYCPIVFSEYYPLLFKLFLRHPLGSINEFLTILPLFVNSRNYVDVFHRILDLPVLQILQERNQWYDEFRYLLNDRETGVPMGSAETFWKSKTLKLSSDWVKLISPKVCVIMELMPMILKSYFKVLLYENENGLFSMKTAVGPPSSQKHHHQRQPSYSSIRQQLSKEMYLKDMIPILFKRISNLFPALDPSSPKEHIAYISHLKKKLLSYMNEIILKNPHLIMEEDIKFKLIDRLSIYHETNNRMFIQMANIIGSAITSCPKMILKMDVVMEYFLIFEKTIYEKKAFLKMHSKESQITFKEMKESEILKQVFHVILNVLCKIIARFPDLDSKFYFLLTTIIGNPAASTQQQQQQEMYFPASIIKRSKEIIKLMKYRSIIKTVYIGGGGKNEDGLMPIIDEKSSLNFLLRNKRYCENYIDHV